MEKPGHSHFHDSKRIDKMKPPALVLILLAIALAAFTVACRKRADFVPYLSNEIASLGGRTNGLAGSDVLLGRWTTTRDELGAAIDTKGIGYEQLSNLLTRAYGVPQFYSAGNVRHGPTFIYPLTNAGISIFISSTETGAELTLTKPLRKIP